MANTNIKIFFPGEKSLENVISEILKKNGIEEDIDEAVEKIEQGEISNIELLRKIVKDFVLKNITEKDFESLIQQQLAVPIETAHNINTDMKTLVLPQIKIFTPNKQISSEVKIKNQVASDIRKNVKNINKNFSMEINTIEKQKIKEVPKKTKRVGEESPKEKTPKSNKRDQYREPIE